KCQAVLRVPRPSAASADHGGRVGEVEAPAPADPRQELLRQILGAFQGDLPPLRRTSTYRLGILSVAGAMLLLPVLYVALIALIILLVAWHAIYTPTVLQGSAFLLG